MACVCCYFQVHQPYRLRRYSVFDTEPDYWDRLKNAEWCRQTARRSYLPAARILLDAVRRHDGKFRFGLSITGVALEQMRAHAPDAIEGFAQLAGTGCVEFLAETYYHSLASIYSEDEFTAQVEAHRALIRELFGQDPRVLRNTELIYNNELAPVAAGMGFKAVVTEGADHILGQRSPNYLYRPAATTEPPARSFPAAPAGAASQIPFSVSDQSDATADADAAGPSAILDRAEEPAAPELKLLLKNHRLSDDIAVRFSERQWEQWPLTAPKFARWVDLMDGHGQVCNLFMDLETFGERQWAETGVFDFLAQLPGEVLRTAGGNRFLTPGQVADSYPAIDELDVPHPISWTDVERDLSAWLGNAMQSNALHELYKLERPAKESADPQLLADWRRLTSSDHFYYMGTKDRPPDGAVHRFENPYESPYDGYINFMNVLDNLQSRLRQANGMSGDTPMPG